MCTEHAARSPYRVVSLPDACLMRGQLFVNHGPLILQVKRSNTNGVHLFSMEMTLHGDRDPRLKIVLHLRVLKDNKKINPAASIYHATYYFGHNFPLI